MGTFAQLALQPLSLASVAKSGGGGVPANALTSKAGDVLTDKTGADILTGKVA